MTADIGVGVWWPKTFNIALDIGFCQIGVFGQGWVSRILGRFYPLNPSNSFIPYGLRVIEFYKTHTGNYAPSTPN